MIATTAQKIHYDLLKKTGTFTMEQVMFTAFQNSPDHFTKKEITELALKVLDANLNNGMIKMVTDGEYKSTFAKDEEFENQPTA